MRKSRKQCEKRSLRERHTGLLVKDPDRIRADQRSIAFACRRDCPGGFIELAGFSVFGTVESRIGGGTRGRIAQFAFGGRLDADDIRGLLA